MIRGPVGFAPPALSFINAAKATQQAGKKVEGGAVGQVSPAALRELREHDQVFAERYMNGDAQGCARMYSEDAEYTDIEGNRHVGRDNIEAAFKKEFDGFREGGLRWKLESLPPSSVTQVSDRRYMVEGNWKLTLTDAQGNDSVIDATSKALIAQVPMRSTFVYQYITDEVHVAQPT